MSKSGSKSTQVRGLKLSVVTFDAPGVFADAFKGLTPKVLAMRLKASARTTEKWLRGDNMPTGAHVIAMLRDDELCARLLKAAGQTDPAHAQETIVALRTALGMVNEGK